MCLIKWLIKQQQKNPTYCTWRLPWVPSWALISGYCLYRVSHFPSMPKWVSSGFSGFLTSLKTINKMDWLLQIGPNVCASKFRCSQCTPICPLSKLINLPLRPHRSAADHTWIIWILYMYYNSSIMYIIQYIA